MDSLRAARYPFLRDASEYAEKNSEGIEAVLSSQLTTYSEARKRGLSRVTGAIKNHTIDDAPLIQEGQRLREVLSYPYARIIVSCINDRLLTKRYALAEAERMNTLLGNDPDAIGMIASELEINYRLDTDGTVSMHFADYLRYSYVMRASEWNLINTDIRDGYVMLDSDRFVRLLQNAYRSKIERELPLNVPEDLKKYVQNDVNAVNVALSDMKRALSPTGGGAVKDECLPPCIRGIISMAKAGQNLPHSARFALVSFLHALGMSYGQIVSVFAESPDFDESVSEYQIKHITGELNGTEGYTPPECTTMKTNGICFDPDGLCESIKHPLNYYRIKSGNRGPKDD